MGRRRNFEESLLKSRLFRLSKWWKPNVGRLVVLSHGNWEQSSIYGKKLPYFVAIEEADYVQPNIIGEFCHGLIVGMWGRNQPATWQKLLTKHGLNKQVESTAETGLFCWGCKIESRLLKFCQSYATPLSGMAKCDLAKLKQPTVTFCLLIKIVRPRQWSTMLTLRLQKVKE